MKKTISKKAAEKPQVQADPDKRFWVCNGQALSNLRDLAGSLEKMSADDFKHHVNSSKNDFAKWVEDVLKDVKLAKGIAKIKSAKAMARKIQTKI